MDVHSLFNSFLFVIILSRQNPDRKLVFGRRYWTSILFTVCAIGIVGQVEVQFIIIPTLFFKVQVSPSRVCLTTRRPVGEGNKQGPSVQVFRGLVDYQFEGAFSNLESENPILRVSLACP